MPDLEVIKETLSSLNLQHNKITSLHDCQFCPHTQLRYLYLGGNQISDISSTAFNNTVLENLDLSANQFMVVPDLEVIKETLLQLTLSHNQITEFDGSICSGNLMRFYLERNQITYIDPSAFDNCTALQRLRLNGNQLTTLGKVSLEPLQEIDITNDHLVCDSSLLWLKDAVEHGVIVQDFWCAGPPCLQGKLFSSATREELLSSSKLT